MIISRHLHIFSICTMLTAWALLNEQMNGTTKRPQKKKQTLEKWLEKTKGISLFSVQVSVCKRVLNNRVCLNNNSPNLSNCANKSTLTIKISCSTALTAVWFRRTAPTSWMKCTRTMLPNIQRTAAGAKTLPVDVRVNQTIKESNGRRFRPYADWRKHGAADNEHSQGSAYNTLAYDYWKTLGQEDLGRYVRSVYDVDVEYDVDADEADAPVRLDKSFHVYADGKSVEMILNSGVYEGVKALSPDGERNIIMTAATEANNIFKRLVTGWSPVFMLRNFSKRFTRCRALHNQY